jgi:hypothetical protein
VTVGSKLCPEADIDVPRIGRGQGVGEPRFAPQVRETVQKLQLAVNDKLGVGVT